MTDSEPTHGMPVAIARRNTLPLEVAQRITNAALRCGADLGVAMVAAVVDDGGHLIALARADGCSLVAVDTAQVKARTAVMFGTATADLPATEPLVSIMGSAASEPIALFPGGIPLAADGVLVGALGVAGGPPGIDAQAATAGAGAL